MDRETLCTCFHLTIGTREALHSREPPFRFSNNCQNYRRGRGATNARAGVFIRDKSDKRSMIPSKDHWDGCQTKTLFDIHELQDMVEGTNVHHVKPAYLVSSSTMKLSSPWQRKRSFMETYYGKCAGMMDLQLSAVRLHWCCLSQ